MERSALALGADRMPVRQSGKQTLATQTSMPETSQYRRYHPVKALDLRAG